MRDELTPEEKEAYRELAMAAARVQQLAAARKALRKHDKDKIVAKEKAKKVATVKSGKLPDLETACDRCEGNRTVVMYRGEENCPNCDWTGFVPTELGRQILDLVEHRYRAIAGES